MMFFYFILFLFCIIIFFTLWNPILFSESFENAPKKYAIITSIYGDYDNLKDHDIPNKDLVDWYCFTDNVKIKSDQWKMIYKPYHLEDPDAGEFSNFKNYYSNLDKSKNSKIYNMMCAKYYKIKTHNIDILQKYEYFIWIDGSIFLRPNFIKNMIANCNKFEMINFKHSERNNIKDEYDLSIKIPKYKNQHLNNQYNSYINNGFPDNIGLFENTIFARKNSEKINRIFNNWWIHNLKYSYQDQISYPYVLWESKFIPDGIIPLNVFNNEEYSYVDFSLMQNH